MTPIVGRFPAGWRLVAVPTANLVINRMQIGADCMKGVGRHLFVRQVFVEGFFVSIAKEEKLLACCFS